MEANRGVPRCVTPRVRFESETELWQTCVLLLGAYAALIRRVVGDKFRARGAGRLAWTELDRLMLGIASFDEVVDGGVPLVLETTRGNGALYAHELNVRIMLNVNRHNFVFFHERTTVCELALYSSLRELLERMLITSSQSHYYALLEENFVRFVAWDAEQWLVCPRHRVGEFRRAILRRLGCLGDDVALYIAELLGVP